MALEWTLVVAALTLIVAAAGLLYLAVSLKGLAGWLERLERTGREDSSRGREELAGTVRGQGDSLLARVAELANLQKGQLDSFAKQLAALSETNDSRLEAMRQTLQDRLREMQLDSGKQLELMRETVGEKLHQTLETRLTESFGLVSQRLEAVQKGLGEMQALATGVGDLKRLLTNVKSRGSWGEMLLKALVAEYLTKDQYQENVKTKPGSTEMVELAVKLPGANGGEKPVWLPVDSKLPTEPYERLLEAREKADPEALEAAGRELANALKTQARKIRDKYVNPPDTTDFAIMYLPVEGLYAEVMQLRGLHDELQRDLRIVVSGPSTFAALLSSLQMGFRTLAIEKKSSDVWRLLGAIKTEFDRFGELLTETQQRLEKAGESVEKAAAKTRTIVRKLSKVQELPAEEAQALLSDDPPPSD